MVRETVAVETPAFLATALMFMLVDPILCRFRVFLMVPPGDTLAAKSYIRKDIGLDLHAKVFEIKDLLAKSSI